MNMKWNHRIVLSLVVLAISVGAVVAVPRSDDDVWSQIDKSQLQQPGIDGAGLPNAYETFRLNQPALETILNRAPEEFTSKREVILTLPMPDGSYSRFRIEHSLVVEPGLLIKFPELGATYRGRGIDDPTATARFDFLPSGFHSIILSANGTVIVDPYSKDDTVNYISYFKSDRQVVGDFKCEVGGDDGFDSITKPRKLGPGGFLADASVPEVTSGTQLRTYRLAVAATNEYAVAVGGNTIAGTLAAQVLIMNRVNGVYERDVAIHMNIVANNNLVVYAGDNTCASVACTSANDPYTNSNGSTMLGENTTTLTNVIGTANYDIGHVFSTGGGGIASLSVPCGSSKARGVTGLGNPIGDPFAIDYVAHEMGHQWGANHTFNGTTSNCGGGNRSGGSAYEPGSGVTIMAYAGICGAQNLAANSIDTFHVKSIEVIVAFSQSGNGNACAAATASGNTPPTVTGPGNFNIPKQTPFVLTATGSDVDGDSITYDWQEYDLGASTTAVPNTDSDGTARPIFRSLLPTDSGTRTFPSLTHVLNAANVPPSRTDGFLTGELLPAIARTMTFQVVARDNRAGAGGVSTAASVVTIDGASGPFVVTSPNTGVSYGGNSAQTVTWNAANTTAAPVSAANVMISLSPDGGKTYPTVLATSTANDGSESVNIPNVATTAARIKVEAIGNIFFDISDSDFSITVTEPTPTPTGLESDIANRNTGDGALLANDLALIRQFVVGSLTPAPGFNEFQRVDAAPFSSLGDGQINSADIAQARHYVAGIAAPQAAGGPLGGSGGGGGDAGTQGHGDAGTRNSALLTPHSALEGGRTMRSGSAMALTGSRVSVDVELDAQGDEVALSFTLNFDPTKLSNPEVTLGNGVPADTILTANTGEKGRLTVLVDSSQTFARGAGQVVTVTFDVAQSAPSGETLLTFSNGSISDARADELPANYRSGSVTNPGPNAQGVEVSGRVLSPDGRGLRNATVTFTNANGVTRTSATSSFGFYRFKGVPVGETYTIGVSSRRYRFASRNVQAAGNLADVDFIGRE